MAAAARKLTQRQISALFRDAQLLYNINCNSNIHNVWSDKRMNFQNDDLFCDLFCDSNV